MTSQSILSDLGECPECGGTNFSWDYAKRNTSGVVDGRLRMHDIAVDFFLGCNDCSETVRVVPAGEVADFLTNAISLSTKPIDESTNWHSPGPWTHSDQVGDKEHCFVAQVWDRSEVNLATLESTVDAREATANARLMAAAPELLVACKAMMKMIMDAQRGISHPEPLVVFTQAGSAIQKATEDHDE